MSKHTPGPWTTYDGYIIESEKCQVGEVYFYSYEEGERIDIPYRANARLKLAGLYKEGMYGEDEMEAQTTDK